MISNRLGLTTRPGHFYFANINAKLGVRTMEELLFDATATCKSARQVSCGQ